MVLLRLTSGDGLIGLGEAVPLSLRGGAELETVVNELRGWSESAVEKEAPGAPAQRPGDPGEGSREIPDRIARARGIAPWSSLSAPSRCAVETALFDLAAREAELPLHELLSPGREPLPLFCNATLTTDSPVGVLRQAEEWADEGFSVFKLKLGAADDYGQVEAVRSGIGPEAEIRLDANGSWALERAVEVLAGLEPLRIELAEQPVADLATMAGLKQRTSIPLVADESVSDPRDAEEAQRIDACDAITAKLSKIGGLDAGLGNHLPTYLSSALDGPVGIAAAAHVAQTLDRDGPWAGVAHGLATSRLFSATIAEDACALEGPFLRLPGGSGLGVVIDEDSLQNRRL